MKPPSTLARLAVIASSLTLLVGYVVYSHQSAQVPLALAGEEPMDHPPKPKAALLPADPIAALAAHNSRAHQLRPALNEGAVEAASPPGSAETLWKSPMNARILGDRGNGSENSERMTTPAKLAAKYFRPSRQIMPGSKSGALFAPPLEISSSKLPPEIEAFRFDPPVKAEIRTGLPLPTDGMTSQLDSLPPDPPGALQQPQNIQRVLESHVRDISVQHEALLSSPPDPLELPTNIQRILKDDGHSSDESRKGKSPMNARIPGDRGNDPENSERLTSPAKLSGKYYQSRRIMPGSKSAAVFAPPLEISSSNLPPEIEAFRFDPPVKTEFRTGLPLPADQMTRQLDSLPPHPPGALQQPENIQRILANDGRKISVPPDSLPVTPPDPLEQPQNIQRILASDGSHLEESRRILVPERIAEAIRYEKDAAVVGSRARAPLPNPVSPLYWPLIRLLMPPPPPLLSPLQNTP